MKPKRIIILRHGQSEGNADKTNYNKKPDYSMNLTDLGKQQALEAGHKIKELIGNETVGFYVSPYYRTRQTYQEVIKSLKPSFMREDPRLREHEWAAKFVDEPKIDKEKECLQYGVFYYRFEHGESCADTYDRLSTFLETMHRDFDKYNFPSNVVIVAHGMTNRIFLMRWLHLTIEEFELLANPKNCEYYILQRLDNGKYKLVTEPRRHAKRTSLF